MLPAQWGEQDSGPVGPAHRSPLETPIVIARASLALLLAAPVPQGPFAPDAAAESEPTVRIQALRNVDFGEAPGGADPEGQVRVPWWRTARGAPQLARGEGRGLRVGPGLWAEQPIAAYAPLADSLVLEVELLEGRGSVALVDGAGRALSLELAGPGRARLALAERPAERDPETWPRTPRFVVRLGSDAEGGALFGRVEATLELPAPSEAALRAEILRELEWIVDLWLERSLDDAGPRPTGFSVHLWDVVNGERLMAIDGQVHPLFELLLDALEVEEVPRWRAALERYLADWFELGFHPETGLPCAYDAVADQRLDRPIEIHKALGFLLDLHERGPEPFRARALERARRIGEHVRTRGVVPDGRVAPGYVPESGEPILAYAHLRALDVPAQLARLAARIGDERLLAVAREAVATLEYSHYWPGTWHNIDPGFDDNYGHYGARAIEMWRAWPEEPEFRHLALSGWRTYAPLWRDALRLGGNVAADQVRCWRLAGELVRLEPDLRGEAHELLELAVHSHWIGEQYRDGAWGDVTIYLFEARDNLQVGDLPGVPLNLLQGLGFAYQDELGQRTDATRARFASVLRSSLDAYRRPYGMLSTREERSGPNLCGGSLRLAVGLVEMLRRL